MPDLTEHTTFTCGSNIEWSTQVPSSRGGTHTVTFGPTLGRSSYQYDWSCTCSAYKFGKGAYCKHIKAVKASGQRCGWNSELEVTDADTDAQGDPCCPDCQGPVSIFRVAV